MNSWFVNFRPALAATAIATLATGVAYPLAVWGASNLLFPEQARGSLATFRGRVVGSSRIAQPFPDSGWFQPRPSAAGAGWDAAGSSGSNAGPLNRVYLDTVVPGRVAAYRERNGLERNARVPATAVSASGSGLDPDIALDDALIQAGRVARVRNLDPNALEAFVESRARDGFWHPTHLRPVNVLELNLALEERRVR